MTLDGPTDGSTDGSTDGPAGAPRTDRLFAVAGWIIAAAVLCAVITAFAQVTWLGLLATGLLLAGVVWFLIVVSIDARRTGSWWRSAMRGIDVVLGTFSFGS